VPAGGSAPYYRPFGALGTVGLGEGFLPSKATHTMMSSNFIRRCLVSLAAVLASRAHAMEGGIPARSGDQLARATVAVGTLVQRTGGLGLSYCSGVLIRPDLVLTAAHCVRGDALAATILLYQGSRPVPRAHFASAVARRAVPFAEVPSQYATSVRELTLDTAVLRLSVPIRGRSPIQLATSIQQVPSVLRVAGVGLSGDAAGTLKTTTVTPLLVTASGLVVARANGARLCIGDSGGPVVGHGRGGTVLFGVLSAVLTSSPPCGDVVVIAPVIPET
jgi:secreted trypsin-like serine protease